MASVLCSSGFLPHTEQTLVLSAVNMVLHDLPPWTSPWRLPAEDAQASSPSSLHPYPHMWVPTGPIPSTPVRHDFCFLSTYRPFKVTPCLGYIYKNHRLSEYLQAVSYWLECPICLCTLTPNFLTRKYLLTLLKTTFWSSLVIQWVKDLALSLLRLGFNPWSGNFHIPWMWPKKPLYTSFQ